MNSIQQQIMQKFGQGTSPKAVKQSFFTSNNRVPFQMIPTRDQDKSPSTSQITNSPSDQPRNPQKKIALNKIAFVTGKGSPQQQCLTPHSQQQEKFKFESCFNESSNMQNKQSPVRQTSNEKPKIVLSVNQIKVVKKEQSPSPDINYSNVFKNIKNVCANGQPDAQPQRNVFKNKQVLQRNSKHNLSIMSEDETNIQSDNEENKQQNFTTILKKQENSTNYNKPKLGNNECQDKRSPDQRIKIINPKKIRQSPSPPNQQNILLRVKLSPNQNQPQQLATDLIKGLITQNKPQQFINPPQSVKQETQQQPIKKLGLPQNLKLVRSPNQVSPTNKEQFNSEMLKHGFMKELNDINELNLKLLDPKGPQEAPSVSQRSNLLAKGNFQREYSPPPSQQIQNNQEYSTNIHRISTKEESASKQNKQEINEISSQVQGNEQVFQFPFQRRARSFSPKQDEEKENQTKSKSPSPVATGNDEQKRNKPIIAKTNFVIAHKGVLGKDVLKEETTFERSKEVDEWLMGSGESAATAGSSYSNTLNQLKKQQELERPIQPNKTDELETEGEEEDWMFKTYGSFKNKGKDSQKKAKLSKKSGMIGELRGQGGIDILEDDHTEVVEEESPFDLAPEINKQFQQRQNSFLIGEENVPVCDDLNSYIDKLDELIEGQFR